MSSTLVETLNIQNITWHRRPRESGGGGGVAIAIRNSFGNSIDLNPPNPDNIECKWCLISPAGFPSLKLLVASFYISNTTGHTPAPGTVVKHILETVSFYQNRFPHLYTVLAGDYNKRNFNDIYSSDFMSVYKKYYCYTAAVMQH